MSTPIPEGLIIIPKHRKLDSITTSNSEAENFFFGNKKTSPLSTSEALHISQSLSIAKASTANTTHLSTKGGESSFDLSQRVIVVGGGLAGLSAAHTVLEYGGNVLILEKSPWLGGRGIKDTDGINGTGSRVQRELEREELRTRPKDAVSLFEKDVVEGGMGKLPTGEFSNKLYRKFLCLH